MNAGLLERSDELDVVQGLVDGLFDGEGRLLLIEGPAGIGKSRVLAEVRRLADRHALVLAARAGELEGSFPFGVIRQLFEAVAADPELGPRALAGPATSAHGVLGVPSLGGPSSGNTSFAVLHGLYWLALNLAEERPLVITVDDLHWVDRPSLRFLAYLVRRLEGVPILIAATLRSAEPGNDPGLLAEVAQDPMAVSMRPRPLSGDAVTELIVERLGEVPAPEFTAACQRSTGGNPLLLRQLLTALAADGVRPTVDHVQAVREIAPRAVSRTVLLRLARLSPAAVGVARAIATLGEHAPLPAVAALAKLDEQTAAEATGELARADLLRSEPPLGFVHPLLRDAVYQELPPGERGLMHARAARVLADAGADPEIVAGQLLLTASRADPWVVEICRRAADASMSRGAPDGAVAYLRRALEEPPPPERRAQVLFELGMVEAQANVPGAVEHLAAAQELVEEPEQRMAITQMLGRAKLFTGDPEGAAAVARAAISELGPGSDDVRLSLEALIHMTVYFGAGDPASLTALESYRTGGVPPGPGAKMVASMAGFTWGYQGGTADEAAALVLEALAGGELLAVDSALVAMSAVVTLVAAGRDEVLDVWEAIRADAHLSGSLLMGATIGLWYGYTLHRRGDLDAAAEQLRSSIQMLDAWGFGSLTRAYPSSHLAMVHIERGELEVAERLLEQAGDPIRNGTAAFFYCRARAALRLAQGRPEEALESAAELERRSWVAYPVDHSWWGLRAQALHRLGRAEEAIAAAERELELARGWAAPILVGPALRLLGELEGEAGLDRLREAVDILDGYDAAKLEQAKALASYGAALRRARRPTDAREPLRRALELASACGAPALVEDVRTELHAAGARPRTDALSGVEALTPSERRVVDLAAGGSANREIAQRLYVTPKTVEVHLTNAYRKLGVRSRRELAGALTEG